MIRTDQDVIDSLRDKPCNDPERALSCAGYMLNSRLKPIKNHLPGYAPVLIDVEERLVHGIVRKHVGRDAKFPRHRNSWKAKDNSNALSVRNSLGLAPFRLERLPVRRDLQSVREQRMNGWCALLKESRFEKPLRRRDTEVMCDIEVMQDQRRFHSGGRQVKVQETKRHRMRRGRLDKRQGKKADR